MKGSPEDPPKLNRSYFGKDDLKKLQFERDNGSVNGIHTARVIPHGHALQSSSAPVETTLASESFRNDFNNNKKDRLRLKIDTALTSAQAADGLHDQQSPSPLDEFPELTGSFAAFDYRKK